MVSAPIQTPRESATQPPAKNRQPIWGDTPNVLTEIYREDTNIVIWRRTPSPSVTASVEHLIHAKPTLQETMVLSPDNGPDSGPSPNNAASRIHETLGDIPFADQLSEDIAELVAMFCCLFELKRAGLRLTVLNKAMCPKFHVDKVPCRLVTTYEGIATEWLPHSSVDRTKLGLGSEGKPDEESGLFKDQGEVMQLSAGDVGLLKGELWSGNEGAGLVHRSPSVPPGESRLLLTLDFVND